MSRLHPPARTIRRRLVFWSLVALSILTVAAGLWQWQARRDKIVEQAKPGSYELVDVPAFDFALRDLAGEQVKLSSFRGQVVLVNFWATWCPPCTAEMPDLNALHERYGAEHGLVVLGVNQQEAADKVRAFVTERGLTFPILLDEDGRVGTRGFGVRGLPMSFIIDRDGVIRDAWPGRIERDAMIARLERVW